MFGKVGILRFKTFKALDFWLVLWSIQMLSQHSYINNTTIHEIIEHCPVPADLLVDLDNLIRIVFVFVYIHALYVA